MDLSKIFGYYDKLIMGISPGYSGLLSLGILLLLAWAIYRFIKGNAIWIVLVIIFIPATWPALKSIGRLLLYILQFLLVRIKV
jgi:hypothetical protein